MNHSGIESVCLFCPRACLYLLRMDGTFLNNVEQICTYPTHLNMWRAARLLIIPIVFVFKLTSLRVPFLMRQTLYSPGLSSMVDASPLVGYICGARSKEAYKNICNVATPSGASLSLSLPSPVFLNLFNASEAITLSVAPNWNSKKRVMKMKRRWCEDIGGRQKFAWKKDSEKLHRWHAAVPQRQL